MFFLFTLHNDINEMIKCALPITL